MVCATRWVALLVDNDDDELDIGNKTYEELQIILGQTPKTSYLSTGLEQRLRARKQ